MTDKWLSNVQRLTIQLLSYGNAYDEASEGN